LWNPHTGELLRTIAGNSRSFTAVAFSPDGQFLAGAEEKRQGTIELWNPHTGELLRTLSKICHVSEYTMKRLYGEFSDQAIAFSPDGQFLASTDTQHQGTIKLWNPHTGEPLCITETEGGLGNPLSLAFSPDGQLLVSGYSGGTIYIWKKTNSA
jgi:WD40 repeat protein